MIRVIVLLCVISRANLEMQTYQHQMYISRKSKSNSTPLQNGYVYSRVGKGPGLMTTFDNSYTPTQKYTTVQSDEGITYRPITTECEQYSIMDDESKDKPIAFEQNEERIKAKTKCVPSNERTETIQHETATHFVPAANTRKEMFTAYDADREFRIDNEDIRTDSRNMFNGWPYSYLGPYEYAVKKHDSMHDLIEDTKDKRFIGADTHIIPVHEDPEDYDSYSPLVQLNSNPIYYRRTTTDNPMYGDQPFISFVLNDYYDKNNEEDPFTFTDFSSREEYDDGPYLVLSDNEKRNSGQYSYPKKRQDYKHNGKQYNAKVAEVEKVTEKAFDNNQEYDKHFKGDEMQNHKSSEHTGTGHHQTGFRNFLDTFANKFGSENQNQNSKFSLKHNQDKGEKRKGFRRVYHKDEYQEDNEFYDNTNKNAQAEENGGTNFNSGGSQALLQSHGSASVGNEANSLLKRDEANDKTFEKNSHGFDRHKGYDGEINRYKSMAKDTALSNNADYIDHYRI